MIRPHEIRLWVKIAFLFFIRSLRSTIPLCLMMVIAVSALVFLSALSVGVKDAMLRNTVGFFSGHITGWQLPSSLSPEELKIRGVKGVLKRVCLPGVLSDGTLDRPATVCGVDPRREAELTALPEKIIQGRYPKNNRRELLISASMAQELKAQKGSSLLFSPSGTPDDAFRVTVSGIYQSRIDLFDGGAVFCSIQTLGGKESTWSAAVFLKKGVDAEKIVGTYREKWPEQRFQSWEEQMPDLRQLIDLEHISMTIVIILVFGVVSVGIACSFVIFIIKNLREYGIMKAMGVTAGEMSTLIVLKVALMNILACSAGIIIGCLAVWGLGEAGGLDITSFTSHNRYFAVSGVIYPRLTLFSILAPPVTAILFSLLAAVWPAALLAKKKAADIMRIV